MKRTSKVVSIILSVFMLTQMMTSIVFADNTDLTWTLEPIAEKEINPYSAQENDGMFTYGMGFCFKSADNDKYGVMDKTEISLFLLSTVLFMKHTIICLYCKPLPANGALPNLAAQVQRSKTPSTALF